MSIYVIRHGLSQANNRENIGTPAFGAKDAELMKQGIDQSRKLSKKLLEIYGFETSIPVATSELLRTQQTAAEAGYTNQSQYSVLNEVELYQNELADFRERLENNDIPESVIDKADSILENTPDEKLWFTHGLCIAGLCAKLGVYKDRRLIPKFCEIRELPI